jgi:teichuronic acid biosynthesis glycosyltransferase TuaG
MQEQQKKMHNTGDEPLVSVIIPVYNAEKYIEATILSVVNQTYKKWELLLIDNCSTDESLNKLYSYESPTIKILKTDSNSGGPAAPRNLGVKHARGEYVAFLDADDLWEDTKLEVQLHYLKTHDFVCSLASTIDENGNLREQVSPTKNKHYSFYDLVKRNRVINSSVMVSREKFLAVMFDEDPLLHAFEDYHAYMTYALLYGSVLVIGEALIVYRVMAFSLGGRISAHERFVKSMYCFIKVSLASKHDKRCFAGIVRRYLSYFTRRWKELFSSFAKP